MTLHWGNILINFIRIISHFYNQYSISLIIIIITFSGFHDVAVNIALAQAWINLVFIALGANSRLRTFSDDGYAVSSIMMFRVLVAIIVLCGFSTFYFFYVEAFFIFLLTSLRRSLDWIFEIVLAYSDTKGGGVISSVFYLCMETLLVCLTLSFGFFGGHGSEVILNIIFLWSIVPLVLIVLLKDMKFSLQTFNIPNFSGDIFSTIFLSVPILFQRLVLVAVLGDLRAAQVISCITMVSGLASIGPNIILPTVFKKIKIPPSIVGRNSFILIVAFTTLGAFLSFYLFFFDNVSFLTRVFIWNSVGGIFVLTSLSIKVYIITVKKYSVLVPEILIFTLILNFFLVAFIFNLTYLISISFFIVGVINLLVYVSYVYPKWAGLRW